MTAAMCDSLRVVEASLGPRLVSRAAVERLFALTAALPAALSSCWYLERPLARDAAAAPVDLIVNLDARGLDILAGENRAATFAPELRSTGPWDQLEKFARGWRRDDSALHRDVEEIWLEFDIPADAAPVRGAAPAPSVFVDFVADVYHGSPTRRTAAVIHALAKTSDTPLAPDALRSLRTSIERLPDNGLPLYAGRMLGRSHDPIRLCLMGLAPRDLTRYLDAIAWPGSVDDIAHCCSELARLDGGAHERPAIVHLDFAPALQPTLGLEYPFARESQRRGCIAETELLDYLVARDLATKEERSALAAWPGRDVMTMPHELWPSVLDRRVNHIKLAFGQRGGVTAKAYLCCEHAYAKPTRR